MASNYATFELCPTNDFYGTGLLTDDVVLHPGTSNQAMAFATQSNVAPCLSVRGSNVSVVGNLNLAQGVFTSGDHQYGTPLAAGPADSNFSIIFRTSNVANFSGYRILARNQWYTHSQTSNVNYTLSNVLGSTAGGTTVLFPYNGIYTVAQGQAMVQASYTVWFDPLKGWGNGYTGTNQYPAWRVAHQDTAGKTSCTAITSYFTSNDMFIVRGYGGTNWTPTLSNGGTWINLTMHCMLP